jgi:hypothetical protein
LRGFKVAYQNADIEGKAAILACVVDHVVLGGKQSADSEFFWKPPFDVLFFIGSSASKSEAWGKSAKEFLTFIRHLTIRPVIAALRQETRPQSCLRTASRPAERALKHHFKNGIIRPEESR